MAVSIEDRVRVTARIPAELRKTLEEAAGLSGATLNQFVVQSALECAQRILEQETVIKLSREQAKKVFAMLDNPPKPTKKLKEAFKLNRKLISGA